MPLVSILLKGQDKRDKMGPMNVAMRSHGWVAVLFKLEDALSVWSLFPKSNIGLSRLGNGRGRRPQK